MNSLDSDFSNMASDNALRGHPTAGTKEKTAKKLAAC